VIYGRNAVHVRILDQVTHRARHRHPRSEGKLIASAVVVLLFAAMFGLMAAYHALIDVSRFTPIEAAALVGGSLVGVGILVLRRSAPGG
jgi:hypothetical protein